MVILRIGASYSSEISTHPYRPIVDEGELGRLMSNSDFIDVKSLVSNSGSCERTTIHCRREGIGSILLERILVRVDSRLGYCC